MNYEQLVEAKARLVELNATVGLWCGGAFLLLALILMLIGWIYGHKKFHAEWPAVMLIVGAFVGFIALASIPINIYDLKTAEIQARAYLANYNFIELKK